MLNTAVLIPMPSASVSTATIANPGSLWAVRRAYRRSWASRSIEIHRHIARTSSITSATFPNACCAAYRASSGVRPFSCCSLASNSRSARISRSRSRSRSFRHHQCISALLDRPHHPRDRAGQLLPLRFLGDKLLLASRGQSVVFELSLQVFPHRLPFGREPPFTFQPVECGIQRSVLNLQQVIGGPLDMLCDLVPVSGPKHQNAQD